MSTGAASCKNQVKLKVVEAKDLKAADIGGKSDPYCALRVLSLSPVMGTVVKTRVVKSNLCPVWGDEFVFQVVHPRDDVIEIKIYDEDVGNDDLLGVVTLPVSALLGRQSIDEWHDVRDPHNTMNKGKGSLHLVASYTGEGAFVPPQMPQQQQMMMQGYPQQQPYPPPGMPMPMPPPGMPMPMQQGGCYMPPPGMPMPPPGMPMAPPGMPMPTCGMPMYMGQPQQPQGQSLGPNGQPAPPGYFYNKKGKLKALDQKKDKKKK